MPPLSPQDAATPVPPAEVGPPRRRSSRLVIWSLFGAGIVALLLSYYVMLRRSAGDYLIHERELFALRLRMDGGPSWSDDFSGAPFRGPYLAGLRSVTLWMKAPKSSTSLLRSAQLVAIPGEPNYYRIVSPPEPYWEDRAEWFPPDSLEGLSSDDAAERLAAARDLHARFPDRLTTTYWLIAALFEAGETAEAEGRLDASRAAYDSSANPRAPWLLHLLEIDRRASVPEQAARRAAFARAFLRAGPDEIEFEELIDWLSGFAPRDLPVWFSLDRATPNFVAIRTATRLAQCRAVFLRLEGRRDDAHRLLLGTTAFATATPSPLNEFAVLLACTARNVAIAGAIDDCIHSAAPAGWLESAWGDWEALWPQLPRYDSPGVARALDPHADSFATLKARAAAGLAWMGFDTTRSIDTLCRTEAYRELFREGLRARHQQAVRGEWPRIGADDALEGLLLHADPPPVDPFTDPPRPLRARETTDTLVLWSIGPDRLDDRGAIEYGTTRRSTSGDIVLTLDTVPRYRFPDEPGYVYQGRADFDARYPHGLPEDPFSNTGVALQLTTDGTDLVWSYGPDKDEKDHASRVAPGQQVDVLYDPTNGLDSRGDLYMNLNFNPVGAAAATPSEP